MLSSTSSMVSNILYRPHRLVLLDKQTSTPPSEGGTRPRGSYSNEANFDTNMVVILAVLLCALICALGLNSIVRCALRCSRRFAFETTDETASRLASTGLKKKALLQIPVAIYGSEIHIPSTDCPICLGEFEDGENLRVLPKCNHGFHVQCIDTWLVCHSSCPTCRQSLLELPPISDSARTDSGIRYASSGGGQEDVPIITDEVS